MCDKCTCPSVMKVGTRFPMIRDRDCPEHGDNVGILRDMKDEKQAEIEQLRKDLQFVTENRDLLVGDTAEAFQERDDAVERAGKAEAKLASIKGVKTGAIRIRDTKSVLLHSPTYCAFCGQMFTDTENSTEQIREHIEQCPDHPLRKRAQQAEAELERAGKDYGSLLIRKLAMRAKCAVLATELKAARGQIDKVQEVVAKQAEDDGLWFIAQTAPEAYVQQELRRLHTEIEASTAKEEKG